MMHVSGQFFEFSLSLHPVNQNPQAIGSAITYGRRYSFNSMLNIVSGEGEDDGNAASVPEGKQAQRQARPPQKRKPVQQEEGQGNKIVTQPQLKRLFAIAKEKGWDPDDVKIAFGQAFQSLNEKIWDGCVTMAGRALQEAMTDLKAEGDTLYAQIEYLAGQNKITPDLKDWAHEGRLGRNLGAHGSKEEQGKKWSDESDAEEIVEFCKWFFRYVYILPKQLEQRRERLVAGAKLAEEAATEEES